MTTLFYFYFDSENDTIIGIFHTFGIMFYNTHKKSVQFSAYVFATIA